MQPDASHSELGQPEERSIGVFLMLCNTQEMIQSWRCHTTLNQQNLFRMGNPSEAPQLLRLTVFDSSSCRRLKLEILQRTV
jgi:hypothetical protein